MIKAFLFDLDDTLTRVSDFSHYRRGSYKALASLLRENGLEALTPDFDAYQTVHSHFYNTGACHFTAFANEHGLSRDRLFQGHHDLIDETELTHDKDSANALNALKGRALIFSDGARSWATQRMKELGVDLPLYARDDEPEFERKCNSPRRFGVALDRLNNLTGEILKPENVLMFDDSSSVLRQAKDLGYRTAFCHFGTLGRSGNGGFDFEVHQVGEFLQKQGFVPATPADKSVAAPKAQLT